MGERLKIERFVSEPEQGPERYFDPKKDITGEQWAAMSPIFEYEKEVYYWYLYSGYALLRALVGEKLELTDGQWRILAEERNPYHQNALNHEEAINWVDFALLARLEMAAGKAPDYSSLPWDRISAVREEYAKEGFWESFASLASFEILVGRKVNITAEQWASIAEERQASADEDSWYDFVNLALLESLRNVESISYSPDGKLQISYKGDTSKSDEATTPPMPRKF